MECRLNTGTVFSDYQCIIELILVSKKVDLRVDSNDSSSTCTCMYIEAGNTLESILSLFLGYLFETYRLHQLYSNSSAVPCIRYKSMK